MKRPAWLIIPTLALSLSTTAFAAGPAAPPAPAPYVVVDEQQTPLAQGLSLTSFERLYPAGWVNGWLLTADLASTSLRTDLLTAPGVTKGEPLSAMAARAGAVAAVNGDFFDIGQTGIALGGAVQNGQFLQSRIPGWPLAAGVGKDRIGRLLEVSLDGTVTLPSGSYPLGAINLPTVPAHAIGLFTPLWSITRSKALYGATEGREVIVRGGKVVSVSDKVTDQPIPADGFVLIGREEYAKPLASLKVGDPVRLAYRPKPDVQWAVGGMRYLVAGGQVTPDLDDTQRKPRSALGFTDGGRKMLLLAVDGRSEESGGLTLRELAEMMRSFGASDVLEIDGGGSTTMVARLPGQPALSVVNKPSDGKERAIPNGVGIFATPGTGRVAAIEIGGERRLFPGMARQLTIAAYDEQYGPAQPDAITWQVEGPGEVTPDGLYRAEQTGKVKLVALTPGADTAEPVRAGVNLQVLGRLERIEAVGQELRLAVGMSGTFAVRGYDHEGFNAAIDPGDLSFEYDPSLVKVEAVAGEVSVTPLQQGEGLIKVTAQSKVAFVPFTSAQAVQQIDIFDRPAAWTFQSFPATVGGALSAAPGRQGTGLQLSYDFGKGATRAAYAQAAPEPELPGRPEAMGLWVKGDGKGAWLRAVLRDAKGTSYTLNLARRVDWSDWRYVEAKLPAGVAFPVTLYRVYPVETDAEREYAGALVLDDLTVKGPVELPPVPAQEPTGLDPVLSPQLPVGVGSWNFALVGTRTPPEPEGQRLLQQAMAANPTLLFLDPAATEPSVRELVKQEAGDTPVYQPSRSSGYVDVESVRFILVGTEGGTLRTERLEQLLSLRTMLDLARLDTRVERVVVVGHDSPLAFADQREGALVARWLTDFEERSGKQAVYLAMGGSSLNVRRVDGIPYIEVGSPAEPLLVTIDPTPGHPWIRVQPN